MVFWEYKFTMPTAFGAVDRNLKIYGLTQFTYLSGVILMVPWKTQTIEDDSRLENKSKDIEDG